jgi:hypothetical protein
MFPVGAFAGLTGRMVMTLRPFLFFRTTWFPKIPL